MTMHRFRLSYREFHFISQPIDVSELDARCMAMRLAEEHPDCTVTAERIETVVVKHNLRSHSAKDPR